MQDVGDNTQLPCTIEGDFNSILLEEEKMRGLHFSILDAWDFANYINYCALIELKILDHQLPGGMVGLKINIALKGWIGF